MTVNRERLAAFLFRIMRDDLPTGTVEDQVQVVEGAHSGLEPTEYLDAAKPLGEYARQLAKRLVPDDD